MPAKQCPQCLMWVNDEERLSGQCPGCKSFFESEIPGQGFVTPTRASNAPTIQTESTSSRAQRRGNSGLWSAWWLIPVALIGMRACSALVKSDRSPRPSYDYRPPQLEGIDEDRLRHLQEMLEQMKRQRGFPETLELPPLDPPTNDEEPYQLPSESPIETSLPGELSP